MKNTNYRIENNKLIANYETYNGKKGTKEFIYAGKDAYGYKFREEGTKNCLVSVRFCNLSKCFTPLTNNTGLSSFIEADLTHFDNIEPMTWNPIKKSFFS